MIGLARIGLVVLALAATIARADDEPWVDVGETDGGRIYQLRRDTIHVELRGGRRLAAGIVRSMRPQSSIVLLVEASVADGDCKRGYGALLTQPLAIEREPTSTPWARDSATVSTSIATELCAGIGIGRRTSRVTP